MKPEFLKSGKKSMNEGPLTDSQREGITFVGDISHRAIIHRNTGNGGSEQLIGMAWFNGKSWDTTMGFCWVGSYPTWEEALDNCIVAYFG